MLAGTVYFYKNNKVVKKMDMYDYEDLSKDEFMKSIEEIQADKVILNAFSNNHQTNASKEILYKRNEVQEYQ